MRKNGLGQPIKGKRTASIYGETRRTKHGSKGRRRGNAQRRKKIKLLDDYLDKLDIEDGYRFRSNQVRRIAQG